jgi:hypothetical protein
MNNFFATMVCYFCYMHILFLLRYHFFFYVVAGDLAGEVSDILVFFATILLRFCYFSIVFLL